MIAAGTPLALGTAVPPVDPVLIVLLALGSASVIVMQCAAIAEVLDVSLLPATVKRVWIGGLILFPLASAVLWFRLPVELRRGRYHRHATTLMDDQLTA
ncbi:hypothetical protein [Microbacterium lacusdiani]